MGKRKKSSRTPQGPKKREPLPTVFKCVFCNHESSVNVKMDKKAGVGNLNCKQCATTFQTSVNYLSAPVDVYAEWIDACENVADDRGDVAEAPAMRNASQPAARARRDASQSEKYAVEEDGFVVDDEPDGEAEYADEG